MRHLFTVSILALASLSAATPGVLVEATNDTVMRITYTGGSPGGNDPALMVTGEKSFGAKIGGSWRGVTGFVPGHTEPYPGSPAGVAAAGPIGLAALATGAGYYSIGAHIMSEPSYAYGANWGIEVNSIGGGWNYGLNVSASGGTYATWAAWFNGDTWATGSYLGSDQKLKKNIKDLSGGLDKVMALKPKTYDMKVEELKDQIILPKGHQIGLIAQDLETVLPDLVINATAPARLTEAERKAGVEKKGLEVKSVNYIGIIPVLIAAVQEQQALIKTLQAEVTALKAGK